MSSVSIHALWQSNWFTGKQGKSQPPPSPWHPTSVTLTSSDWNLLTAPMNTWKLPPKISIGLSLVSFLSTGKAKLLITFHLRQVSSQCSLPPASGWCFWQQNPLWWTLPGTTASSLSSLAAVKPNLSLFKAVSCYPSCLNLSIFIFVCLILQGPGLETCSLESLLCGLASSVEGPSPCPPGLPAQHTQKHQLLPWPLAESALPVLWAPWKQELNLAHPSTSV